MNARTGAQSFCERGLKMLDDEIPAEGVEPKELYEMIVGTPEMVKEAFQG